MDSFEQLKNNCGDLDILVKYAADLPKLTPDQQNLIYWSWLPVCGEILDHVCTYQYFEHHEEELYDLACDCEEACQNIVSRPKYLEILTDEHISELQELFPDVFDDLNSIKSSASIEDPDDVDDLDELPDIIDFSERRTSRYYANGNVDMGSDSDSD